METQAVTLAAGNSPRVFTHRYECIDRSALAKFIIKVVAPVVDTWIPARLTANHVTLMGAIAALTMAIGIIQSSSELRIMLAPLWTALLWGYCILDHVDGYRARQRYTVSAWGEYIDHATDSTIVSFVVMVALMFGAGKTVSPSIAIFFFAATAMGTVAIWAEQYSIGKLKLPLFGPVEGILVAGLYMLSWRLPGAENLWKAPAYLTLNVIEVVLVALGLASIFVALGKCSKREAVRLAIPFALTCMFLCAVVLARQEFLVFASVILALHLSTYSALLILAHLGDKAPSWRYWSCTTLCSLAVLGPTDKARHPQFGLWSFPILLALGLVAIWLGAWRRLYRQRAMALADTLTHEEASARSQQWLTIWERKASRTEKPLHHINGYDLLSESEWRHMIRDLAPMLALKGIPNIAELGCGAGAFIDALQQVHPSLQATGIDYSPALIDVARRRVPGTFSVGDARFCSSLPSNHFDAACSFSTTMYFDSVQDVLMMVDEMRRITRPGGTIFIGDISNAELRDHALRSRRTTHRGRDLISDLDPDHLYLHKSIFVHYATKHGMEGRIYDHNLFGFARTNPLAGYRFSVALKVS